MNLKLSIDLDFGENSENFRFGNLAQWMVCLKLMHLMWKHFIELGISSQPPINPRWNRSLCLALFASGMWGYRRLQQRSPERAIKERQPTEHFGDQECPKES